MAAQLNIGQVPQLFFDNYAVEMTQSLTRRMHLPEKCPDNPLIRQDRPWEVTAYFRTGTVCVAFDPDERLYKCWYCDYAWDYERYRSGKKKADGLMDVDDTVTWFGTTDNRWLYAESEDGIHWVKPELDYREIDGRKTNICLGREDYGQVHVASFFLDALESDPDKRFKAFHYRQRGPDPRRSDHAAVSVAHSADGRVWTTSERTVVVGQSGDRRFGDEMVILPDPVTGQYILNARKRGMGDRLMFKDMPRHIEKNWERPQFLHEPLLICKRRVFVTNSNSLWEWPTLRTLLTPDNEEDNIDEQFYSLPIIRIGDLFIGFLNILHCTDNTMNVQLVYSRDGFHWERAERGRTFLDVGSADADPWERYLVEVGNTVVLGDDAIRIYYGGSACHHDWWMVGEEEGLDMPDEPGVCKTALGLATLRPEGFFSMDSTVRPALLLTRVFTSDGSRLVVNVECGPKGYLDVELTDASDRAVEGYEREACDTFTGDSTRHIVTWRGKSHLPRETLAGGARLRFYSRHCSLYSFRIAGDSESC